MGDDPMALLGLEGALKHYYYYYMCKQLCQADPPSLMSHQVADKHLPVARCDDGGGVEAALLCWKGSGATWPARQGHHGCQHGQ